MADAHADEVVEIAVGQALDIQIDGRAFELEFRAADDVDFLLPNRQRLEGVIIFLAFVALPLGPAAAGQPPLLPGIRRARTTCEPYSAPRAWSTRRVGR